MMIDAAAGPFAAACLLLVFAGVAKITQPAGTRPAAAALGLPASRGVVRALGAVEAAVATAGLLIGGPAAAAVAVIYGALTVAAWRLLARAPGTPCGCLGASDAPVTATHVVVNVAAVVAAALASAGGAPLAAVGSGSWSRLAFVVLVGCCAALVTLVVEGIPRLDAAVREGGSR